MKKILEKKLTKTRKQVSKNWSNYQNKKSKILGRKLNSLTKQKKIKDLYKKTKVKNREAFEAYREYKFLNFSKRDYFELSKGNFNGVQYITYEVRQEETFDYILNEIISKHKNDNIRYILTIGKFYNKETEQTQFYSNNYTLLRIELTKEMGNSFVSELKEHLNQLKYNTDLVLKRLFIKIFFK